MKAKSNRAHTWNDTSFSFVIKNRNILMNGHSRKPVEIL